MPIYLNVSDDPMLAKIIRAALPNNSIRRVEVFPNTEIVNLTRGAYWSGGCRTYYYIVNVDNYTVMETPSAHPFFEKKIYDEEMMRNFPLKEVGNCVVVCHLYSGVDQYLEVYTPGTPKFLPAAQSITDNERKVLIATKSYKSSYAGVSDYRKHELMRTRYNDLGEPMTSQEVDDTRAILREKGLLDKRNAITNAGRNALNG